MTDTLTDEERGVILHALGLERPCRWSSRNMYRGQSDICKRLAEKWMMVQREDGNCYFVTVAGAKAAGVAGKLRREDREQAMPPRTSGS